MKLRDFPTLAHVIQFGAPAAESEPAAQRNFCGRGEADVRPPRLSSRLLLRQPLLRVATAASRGFTGVDQAKGIRDRCGEDGLSGGDARP